MANLYGPTEATIDVTYFDCFMDLNENSGVPIGRPIVNTQIFLLNAIHSLAPFGAVVALQLSSSMHLYIL